MQPNRDFLPPYVQPFTGSVSFRPQPQPLPEYPPLVHGMSVTREGFRRHVASWRTTRAGESTWVSEQPVRTGVTHTVLGNYLSVFCQLVIRCIWNEKAVCTATLMYRDINKPLLSKKNHQSQICSSLLQCKTFKVKHAGTDFSVWCLFEGKVPWICKICNTIVVYEYCLLVLDGLFYMLVAIELNE